MEPKPKDLFQKCRECGGSGKLNPSQIPRSYHPSPTESGTAPDDCRACGGTGVFLKEAARPIVELLQGLGVIPKNRIYKSIE